MKLRVCVAPGCGAIAVDGSRCFRCAADHAERRRLDRERREPWRYVYNLSAYREAREAARRQAGYRCEDCGAIAELGSALDADHDPPLHELWNVHGGATSSFEAAATDPRYLVIRCRSCHARAELERRSA